MENQISVFKFGGASVKDAESIRNLIPILQDYKGQSLAIVISAMGKTTNALEKVVEAYVAEDGQANSLLDEVKQHHFQVLQDLFEETSHPIFADINDAFVEIDWVLEEPPVDEFDYIYDQVVSVGEVLSTKIIAAFLSSQGLPTHWLDARDVIRTDNLYREAWVQWPETIERAQQHLRPLLGPEQFVLTQGFIGCSSENFTTTLGREGSDYTAAILAYCLDAEIMTIWKDVPGVLTADPRLFDNVSKLDRLSYREAIEMTYYGAKVIHPKTIKPLQNKNIPLLIKSFVDPSGSGTRVSELAEENYPPMVAVEGNQALLHISTKDFSFVAEHHLSFLFKEIAAHRLQVNIMQNTAISFAVCVNDVDGRVDAFAKSIETDFKVDIERGLKLITVRHSRQDVVDDLVKNKVVLFEERIRKTQQMVVKDVPAMRWKKEVQL
ncbi:MAG: aspartate kinase [Bacteroidota bacterium]